MGIVRIVVLALLVAACAGSQPEALVDQVGDDCEGLTPSDEPTIDPELADGSSMVWNGTNGDDVIIATGRNETGWDCGFVCVNGW